MFHAIIYSNKIFPFLVGQYTAVKVLVSRWCVWNLFLFIFILLLLKLYLVPILFGSLVNDVKFTPASYEKQSKI